MTKSELIKGLLGMALCVLVAGVYLWFHLDMENILKPQPATPQHMTGQIKPSKLAHPVQTVSLPSEVYTTMQGDREKIRYFLGNQKYVVVLVMGNKPEGFKFKNELKRLFTQGYDEYYRKWYHNFGNSWQYSCHQKGCAVGWLYENCMQKVCIIHPQKKQVIIDSSADVNQLEKLLDKYKDW